MWANSTITTVSAPPPTVIVNSTGTIVNGVVYKTPNITEPRIPLTDDYPASEQNNDMYVLPDGVHSDQDLG